MKTLLRVLAFIALVLGVQAAFAQGICPVSNGASVATIKSTIAACPSGSTVAVAAGTYGPFLSSSQTTLPCGVSLSGPVVPYSQTHNQTAIFQGSSSGGSGFPFKTLANCSASQIIEYLEWDGMHPTGSGGGFLSIAPGTTNLTVANNYFHGVYSNNYQSNLGSAESLIYFAGGNTNQSNPTQNVTITHNEFGPESGFDCGLAFQEGDTEYSQGVCAGIIGNAFLKNVTWDHNILQRLENGEKVIEVTTNNGSSLNSGNTQNLTVAYEYWHNNHRINWETQSNWYTTAFPSSQLIEYNLSGNRDNTANLDNPYATAHGLPLGNGQSNYDMSIANGCGNPPATNACTATAIGNADIQDLSTNHGAGNEFWGDSASVFNNGFMEGYVASGGGGGVHWAKDGSFTFNNNIFNIHAGSGTNCQTQHGGYWNSEDSPAGLPSCSGNTYSSVGSGTTTSVAPTVSPSSTTFTTSVTVTLTNPAAAGTLNYNTTIWCTTDGTTPVPGSGTTLPYASGATLSFSTTTTLKCVGMWGAINQPYSYPSGYGYVPSAVVTNTYTAGSPPTLQSVSLSASMTSITPMATTQVAATCHYSNGVNTSCNTADAFGNSVSSWNTSDASKVSINTTGLATGVALGSATITATAAGVTSNPGLVITVASAPVTLTSVTLAATGGATSVVAGSTLQLIATCHYSDSSTTTCTTADSHGNSPSSWISSATSIATVSSSGLVTGVAAGSTNLTAVVAAVTSSPALALTVTAAPPTLTGGYLGTPGGVNTLTVGSTLQFSAHCQYSNSTTTDCTVADIYGNAVTSWTSSSPSNFTIGQVGGANPGLATGVAPGGPTGVYAQAVVGSTTLNHWNLTIQAPAVTLTSLSLATTNGVTGLFVGSTNHLIATCGYSDGSQTNCTTTDSHGNVAGSYVSSNPAKATVNSTTGLVTGVAMGTTSFTASVGAVNSPATPLTVLAIPSGTYTFTLSGPITIKGTVTF